MYDFVGGVTGSPTYSWQSSGHFSQGTPSNNHIALTPIYYGEGYTSVKASNACGTVYLCQTICSDGCEVGLLSFPGSNPCVTSGNCGFALMSISPNPSADQLTIKPNFLVDGLNNQVGYEAAFFDATGNKVLTQKVKQTGLSIPKGVLKPGFYILKITLNNRLMETTRVLIE